MESGNTTMMMPVGPTGFGGGMGGGFGGWGGDGWWIILLFLLWGRNGWGGDGMNGGVGAEVQRGFDHSATITKLDGITTGIADATYALNNTMTNGFHGVDSAICNLGYQTQAGFNALGAQMASCCCETQRQIERGFCDTNNTINAGIQSINNKLAQMEYNDLNNKYQSVVAENQSLKFAQSQASQTAYFNTLQEAQTAELLRRLGRDTPVPSYLVPNPNCCYGNYGLTGFGGNGCGC